MVGIEVAQVFPGLRARITQFDARVLVRDDVGVAVSIGVGCAIEWVGSLLCQCLHAGLASDRSDLLGHVGPESLQGDRSRLHRGQVAAKNVV